MRFVIIGAGRVGLRTARVLRDEGHEVTLVERDERKIGRAREQDFTVVEGDGSHEDVLEEAGIAEADAIGALTGDLNTNFAACMIANHNGARTIMRIDEDYREDIYRKYADAVDEVVYPERLGAIGAKNALLGGDIHAIADIAQNLQLVELTVTEESPMRGYSLSEVELPASATIIATTATVMNSGSATLWSAEPTSDRPRNVPGRSARTTAATIPARRPPRRFPAK